MIDSWQVDNQLIFIAFNSWEMHIFFKCTWYINKNCPHIKRQKKREREKSQLLLNDWYPGILQTTFSGHNVIKLEINNKHVNSTTYFWITPVK